MQRGLWSSIKYINKSLQEMEEQRQTIMEHVLGARIPRHLDENSGYFIIILQIIIPANG